MKVNNKLKNIRSGTFIYEYLKACGVDDVDSYLHPKITDFEDVWNYKDMDVAVDILHKHIQNKDMFCIVHDSDQDGDCSSAIQYLFLKSLGMKCKVLSHTAKQHGIRDLWSDVIDSGCDICWIADGASDDEEQCHELKDVGIDVIITDHHLFNSNKYATVINNQIGNVQNKALSGAGVTFQLIRAYCQKYDVQCPNYTDIVACSIISDVCDLTTQENRAFIYYGLNNVTNPFLLALFDDIKGKYGKDPTGVGWGISPLANALARQDEQENKLLFFNGLIGNIDALDAIVEMKRIKRQQDNTVRNVVNEITNNIDTSHKAIIGMVDNENKNYTGLIAGKLVSKYTRPAFVLREVDTTGYSGSMRANVALAKTINDSRLAEVKGHEQAAGIYIKKCNYDRFVKFIDSLELNAETIYDVTASIEPKDMTMDLTECIVSNSILWGKNIETPTFYCRIDSPNVTIYRKKTNTAKIVKDGVEFIKFFCDADTVNRLENIGDGFVEMIVELTINEYNGVKSVQANIKELEINEKIFNFDEIFS